MLNPFAPAFSPRQRQSWPALSPTASVKLAAQVSWSLVMQLPVAPSVPSLRLGCQPPLLAAILPMGLAKRHVPRRSWHQYLGKHPVDTTWLFASCAVLKKLRHRRGRTGKGPCKRRMSVVARIEHYVLHRMDGFQYTCKKPHRSVIGLSKLLSGGRADADFMQ